MFNRSPLEKCQCDHSTLCAEGAVKAFYQSHIVTVSGSFTSCQWWPQAIANCCCTSAALTSQVTLKCACCCLAFATALRCSIWHFDIWQR